MKWYVHRFCFVMDNFHNPLNRMIKDYADYMLNSHPKSKQVDSVQEADTIFKMLIQNDAGIGIDANSSDEWYQIVSDIQNESMTITIEAYNEVGIKWGIVDLMKQTKSDGELLWIEDPIKISTSPAFRKRGMHLNGWVFDYPYSFRSWSVADWKEYIDLLIYLKMNLLMIWPFIETIPIDMKYDDEKYLKDFKEIIDYARNEKGMEVWIFLSVNRVCISDDGICDPRKRPYWYPHLQVDMNPDDPDNYKAIYESRKILYKYINNADGYCIIDSDPGCWVGSPTEEYIKICKLNRELIDEYSIFGRDAKMIFWLWGSWGTHDANKNYSDMFQGIQKDIHEPWLLMAAKNNINKFLQYDPSLSQKTVYIPYEAIEDEPSIPFTNNDYDKIDATFKFLDSHANLYGIMGNAQTPILQLPNTFYFSEFAWNDPDHITTEKNMISKLASYVLPEHAGVIEKAWIMLEDLNPDKVGNPWLWEGSPISLLKSLKIIDMKIVQDIISNLDALRMNFDAKEAGLICRNTAFSPVKLIDDLLIQLKIAYSADDAYLGIQPDTPREKWLERIEVYLGYIAEWSQKTGYGKGILPPRHWSRIKALLKENIHLSRRYLEWEELVPIQERLRIKYGKRIADHLTCMLHNDLLVDKFDIRVGEN
jgi:hypothetical protein